MNPPSNGSTKPLHPIKVVVRRTGLSAHVIRIWEKRYGAVVPLRTESNRRLYSDAEIERLRILKRATETGHNIGQIAELSTEDVVALLPDEPTPTVDPGARPDSPPSNILERCIPFIENLDSDGLRGELDRASVDYPLPVLLEEVIIPLMHQVGDRWESGALRPVHEHMAFDVVRSFLGALRTTFAPCPSAPHLTVATPSGQLHELGALVVATAAAEDGWNVTYLGAGLPAEEIARAAKTKGSSAVALSVVYPADDGELPAELLRLRRCLPEGVELLVGGRASRAYLEAIQAAGAHHVTSLTSTREVLCGLRPTLSN